MLGRIYRRFLIAIFLPAALPLFASSQVVINEIMYDLSTGSDTGREWVEVYNSGASAADIAGWKLFENGSNHSLNNISGGTSIAAGGYAVIADDSAKFLVDWPGFSGVLFDSVFSLNNTGETISLKDGTLTIVDEVTYGSSTGANGDGNSLQKSGSSWIAAASTPGTGSSSGSSGFSSSTPSQSDDASPSSESASSVHYNAISLSNKKPEMASSVSAGRDRLGSVGSPMEFRAETSFSYTRSSIFEWNFGDGTEGTGLVLNHVYEFPGEYVVVLNTTLPEGQAVARVNVKIVEPEIATVSANPERIELKNNSKFEISLFGRALWAGGSAFVFPKDTIVKTGQSISFSSKVTGLRPSGIQDVQVMVVGSTEQPQIMKKIEEQKVEKIASIQARLSELKQQLANMPSPPPRLAVQQISTGTTSEEVEIVVPQTALAKEGWLQTLKRFFLRTR